MPTGVGEKLMRIESNHLNHYSVQQNLTDKYPIFNEAGQSTHQHRRRDRIHREAQVHSGLQCHRKPPATSRGERVNAHTSLTHSTSL